LVQYMTRCPFSLSRRVKVTKAVDRRLDSDQRADRRSRWLRESADSNVGRNNFPNSWSLPRSGY
jgi:hypothetical protein